MKHWILILGLIAVGTALGAQNLPMPKSYFSMLIVGQAVNLNDHGATYSLSVFEDDGPLSHTIVEVGEDYVVVRDIAGVTDSVVPVYSIKAVEPVRTKLE